MIDMLSRLGPFTAALLTATLTAQVPTTGSPAIWTTPDGSRFLLVPDRSAAAIPVVHWVVAIPTPLDADPAGALGLSRAVVRASLDGTRRHGSKDVAAEEAAVAELDAIRAEVWASQGNDAQGVIADDLAARFAAASERAQRLGDRSAWRRALADGPAEGPFLREVQGGTLCHVASPTTALPHVAVLLRDWREDAVLRGFHDRQVELRDELVALTHSTTGRMLKEILGTTYLGTAAARYVEGMGNFVPLQDARRHWQRLIHPSRVLHVLTGGFDVTEVRALLTAAFDRTDLPPSSAPPALTPATARARRSVVPSDGPTGVALAWPIPATATPFEVQVLGEWLVGNPNAFLSRRLARGGPIDLRLSAPFPANATVPLFVLEIEDQDGNRTGDDLEHETLERLSSIAEDLDAKSLGWATDRTRARWTTRVADPADVAFELARECGIVGHPPSITLNPPPTLDSRRLIQLAEEMFGGGPWTVVALTGSR